MATVTIRHAAVAGGIANPSVAVDGPKWDATHTVTGLENVDNTSDVNKPVSTAQAAADAVVTAAFQAADALKAPLASPGFSGNPTVPTASPGDNDSTIANTAFVTAAIAVIDAAKANLASPALTGNPTAPTASPGDNDTSIATTAFVDAARALLQTAINAKADLASPALTGNPTAPTPSGGDNDTSIATTAFVQSAVGGAVVRYDTAQSLTAAQKSQARSNIDVLKKNYVVNGAMMVSQENGTTAGTVNAYYPVDEFQIGIAGTTGTLSTAQVASVTPAGSPNRLRVTVTAADAAVAAGDVVQIGNFIEGLRVAELRFGSASAKAITLQFGVKAPAGTYCVVLANSASNRSYVGEYVISGGEANTDVVKTVTFPGDTSGTWLTDNGIGLRLYWGLMVGSTFQQAANSWSTGNVRGSSNQFNLFGTNGNVFELFDVSLTEGTVAPSFKVPDYPAELILCKRYWEKSYEHATAIGAVTNQGIEWFLNYNAAATSAGRSVNFMVAKRAAPTVTTYSPITGTSGKLYDAANLVDLASVVDFVTARNYRCYSSPSGGAYVGFSWHWRADARM